MTYPCQTGKVSRNFCFNLFILLQVLVAFNTQASMLGSWVDVTQSGCGAVAIPNDGLSDSAAFDCAIAQLNGSGGVIHVPAGTFTLSQPLTLPDNVSMVGVGFSSILYQVSANTGAMLIMKWRSGLRHIQLQQDQGDVNSWSQPHYNYDFQVKVQGDDVLIENVMLFNPLKGILIDSENQTGAVGRTILRDIKGQPLQVGIQIDNALDVVHVEGIHFWPYWSGNLNQVSDWTAANGTGIISYRNDNPQFSQLFFINYNRGLHLAKSECIGGGNCGVTSKPKISQLDCDFCNVGIYIDGDGTKGVSIDQLSVQGRPLAGVGVEVKANDIVLSLEQIDFTDQAANAVRVEGNNNIVQVNSGIVRKWNTSGLGFPAFEVFPSTSTSNIYVHSVLTGNGNGANACGSGAICFGVVMNLNL